MYWNVKPVRYKLESFMQDVVSRYSCDTFKTLFRFSETTFGAIMENIQQIPELLLRTQAAGRPHQKKDLLMMLCYIGSQETIRSIYIVDRFFS